MASRFPEGPLGPSTLSDMMSTGRKKDREGASRRAITAAMSQGRYVWLDKECR